MQEPELENLAFADDSIVPKIVNITRAPTQKECLIKANEYFQKIQKKGFAQKLDPSENIISRNLERRSKKRQKELAEAKEFPNDKSVILNSTLPQHAASALPMTPNIRARTAIRQRREMGNLQTEINNWMNSRIIRTFLREFRTLPFKQSSYYTEVEKSFTQQVEAVITEMFQKGLIGRIGFDQNIDSSAATKFFHSHVKLIRRDLIFACIREFKIDQSKMSKALKAEFSYNIIYNKNDYKKPMILGTDENMMDLQISTILDRFPPNYRADFNKKISQETVDSIYSGTSNIIINEINMVLPPQAKTTPVSPREKRAETPSPPILVKKPRAVLSRPIPSTPQVQRRNKQQPQPQPEAKPRTLFEIKHEPLPRNQLIKNYWNMFDPLNRENKGTNYAQQLSDITDNLTFDFDAEEAEEPDPIIDLPEHEIKKVETKIMPEEEPKEFVVAKSETKKEEKNENYTPGDLVDQRNMSLASKTKEDINKLLKSPLIDELLDSKDDNLHDRLSVIWDELGFTAKQKLSMALKYTSETTHATSLADSISLWEDILVAVKYYLEQYKEVKRTVSFSAGRDDIDPSILNDYFKDLETAESNVRSFNSRLKNLSGDTILINGKDIFTVFEKHRKKLRMIRNGQN